MNKNLAPVVAKIRQAHAALMQAYKELSPRAAMEAHNLCENFKKNTLRPLCDKVRQITETEEKDGFILHAILNTPVEEAVQEEEIAAVELPNQSAYIVCAQHNETGEKIEIAISRLNWGASWHLSSGAVDLSKNNNAPILFLSEDEWSVFLHTQKYSEHKYPTAKKAFAVLNKWAKKANYALTIL
jgi:hypothetical protein